MNIRKHPFEPQSFILGRAESTEVAEMLEWLQRNKIKHILQSNIISLFNEHDKSFFILRWLD